MRLLTDVEIEYVDGGLKGVNFDFDKSASTSTTTSNSPPPP